MCMIQTRMSHFIPRWSFNDKVVYKVFRRNSFWIKKGEDDNAIFSAHRDFEYSLNKVYETKIKRSENLGSSQEYDNFISTGFHSFVYLQDAIDEKKQLDIKDIYRWLRDSTSREFDVYKCIIPARSKYYKGVWEYRYPISHIPNIVSERLIVVEKVELNAPKVSGKTVDIIINDKVEELCA